MGGLESQHLLGPGLFGHGHAAGLGPVVEPTGGLLKQHGVKEGFEQGLPLLGPGPQHLGELALGQQDHLAELADIQPDQPFHLPAHLGAPAGDRFLLAPDQPEQHPLGRLLGGASAAGLQGGVGGGALYPIAGPSGGKLQAHARHRRRIGVIRAQGLDAAIPGHLAIERKAQRIQQKGLAGTRGAVNQEEPLLAEGVEADLHRVGVGAKGLDLEPMGLHRSPPRPTASRASCSSWASAGLAWRPC